MTDLTARYVPVSTMPRWHEFLRPVLEVLADGQVWHKHDMERAVANRGTSAR
jgi:hypothetical protein